MKRIFPLICLVALLISLSGCGRSPYSILDRKEGRAVKAVLAEVPEGATISQMETWAKEIEAKEKVEGKQFMINFYKGDESFENLMATYANGRLATR